jgi:hypothetical protein
MGKKTSGGAPAAHIKISSPRAMRTQVRTTHNVVLQANKMGHLTQTTSHTAIIKDLPDLIDLEDDDDDYIDNDDGIFHHDHQALKDTDPDDNASSTHAHTVGNVKKEPVSVEFLKCL